MSEAVWVAALSLIGTLCGSLGGVMAANRLTVYRLAQLEKKVDKHNNLVERVYRLEGRMTETEHSLHDLKKG